MLKIKEPGGDRVMLAWEADGCYPADVEGFILEDGSQALFILDHWERKKDIVELVLEAGEIIGFDIQA